MLVLGGHFGRGGSSADAVELEERKPERDSAVNTGQRP